MSRDACGGVHLYMFSNPIYCALHPRATEKMWANTFVMISPTHKNAVILFLNTAAWRTNNASVTLALTDAADSCEYCT